MFDFKLKIRNHKKEINLSKLSSSNIKIKFKLKGLYKNSNFKAGVSFIIDLKNNKLKISNLLIYKLEFEKKNNSSSDDIWKNIYTTSIKDPFNSNINSNSDDDCYNEHNRKNIYNNIKFFINSIQIKHNNEIITSIILNSVKNPIKKLNIKGYVRKYHN